MSRNILLCLVALLGVCVGSGASLAAIDISSGSLTQSIADAFVYDLGSNTKSPESSFVDNYAVPSTAAIHSFDEQGIVAARGYDLHSSVASEIKILESASTLISVTASGSSFANVAGGAVGTYGSTQSAYVTNLKFYTSGPVQVDWQFEASGMPGELGITDGIDMRLAIRQYSDATYAGSAVVVTNQFFGEGSSQQTFELTPGYYNLVTQGRVLFNQPNEMNRDGESEWSYEYAITAVPEPASLWIVGATGSAIFWMRGRRFRACG